MDDFYSEMKSTLEDIKSSDVKPQTIRQDSNILQQYFPNMFPDALAPGNPIRWPAFIGGSALSSDMPEFGDKILHFSIGLLTHFNLL